MLARNTVEMSVALDAVIEDLAPRSYTHDTGVLETILLDPCHVSAIEAGREWQRLRCRLDLPSVRRPGAPRPEEGIAGLRRWWSSMGGVLVELAKLNEESSELDTRIRVLGPLLRPALLRVRDAGNAAAGEAGTLLRALDSGMSAIDARSWRRAICLSGGK